MAGALFAAEVLYRSPDFESEVIIPAALASVMAYCTFGLAFGWTPLFFIPPENLNLLTFTNPWQLGPYLLLALFMVVLAMLYTRTFYGLTHLFRQLPLWPHVKPAIGAFLSGAWACSSFTARRGATRARGALLRLRHPAGRHDRIDRWRVSLFLALALLAVALGKILTTGLTIGSGGSGGVFGPSMVIGGCGGGALGILFHRLWPGAGPPSGHLRHRRHGRLLRRRRQDALLDAGDRQRDDGQLQPAPADPVGLRLAFLLSDEQSIYSSQVESRSRSPAHQGAYIRDVLRA